MSRNLVGNPATLVREAPAVAHRTAVGFPKSGLRTTLEEEGSQLALRGRADPLLFYFVFGSALAVGVGGALFVSPQYGITGIILFSVLFSPLLVFSSLGAIRLRSSCVIDRGSRRIAVDEQAYVDSLHVQWPLEGLQAVLVKGRPPSRWASAGLTYALILEFEGERYLALEGTSDASLRRIGQRISRFLGIPLRIERRETTATHGRALDALAAAAIFLVPIIVACGLLAYALRFLPTSSYLVVVSMSSLIVCQVGAILAYVYVRSRPATSA